ncbi:MAG: HAD hydrolase-like protein [Thermoanaerobaculia bacterium]
MKQPIVIFDLDGTLTDPREGITTCLLHALRLLGKPLPERDTLERYIGPPLREVFETLVGDGEMVDLALTTFRDRYGTVGLFENRLLPGVADGLRLLRPKTAAMFIATSKPWQYAERIVEYFGIRDFFARVYGSELSGERADKAALLAHLIEKENLILGSNIVMIGDREHDIRAARANDIRSVGVTWGFGSEDELRAAGAGAICSSFSELIEYFTEPRANGG